MNLTTRQPLFKNALFFPRFRRGFSNTYIRHNHGEISVDVSQELEVVGPDLLAFGQIGAGTLKLRREIKNKVEKAIRNKYGDRFKVEFFGSIHYGVSHPKSDLDLVVLDPKLPQGYKRLNGLGAIYNMKMLAKVLSRAGFGDVSPRPTASVPIVRFRDPASGLDCDINVNDRMGLQNSSMIKEYCDAHPYLRPLLYRIKQWAKSHGLNSPSPVRGIPVSFSSYALALMTISFLQKDGHLPNLQENLPPLPTKAKYLWTRKPHRCWDARFHLASGWVPPPLPDFEILLSAWFSYWIDFPYETESISIRHGGTTIRTFPPPEISKKKKKKKIIDIAPMSLDDPFILTKNVTKSISKRTFELFKAECQKRLETGIELQ